MFLRLYMYLHAFSELMLGAHTFVTMAGYLDASPEMRVDTKMMVFELGDTRATQLLMYTSAVCIIVSALLCSLPASGKAARALSLAFGIYLGVSYVVGEEHMFKDDTHVMVTGLHVLHTVVYGIFGFVVSPRVSTTDGKSSILRAYLLFHSTLVFVLVAMILGSIFGYTEGLAHVNTYLPSPLQAGLETQLASMLACMLLVLSACLCSVKPTGKTGRALSLAYIGVTYAMFVFGTHHLLSEQLQAYNLYHLGAHAAVYGLFGFIVPPKAVTNSKKVQ